MYSSGRRIAANIDKLPEPAKSGTVTNAVKRGRLSTELFVDRRAKRAHWIQTTYRPGGGVYTQDRTTQIHVHLGRAEKGVTCRWIRCSRRRHRVSRRALVVRCIYGANLIIIGRLSEQPSIHETSA